MFYDHFSARSLLASKCEKMRRISLTVCMLISSHITRRMYMYRSRNITKNSKNNSHVHNTLGWDNICKYDLRKMSAIVSSYIVLHKKECLCMYVKYVHLCVYIYAYTQIHL